MKRTKKETLHVVVFLIVTFLIVAIYKVRFETSMLEKQSAACVQTAQVSD